MIRKASLRLLIMVGLSSLVILLAACTDGEKLPSETPSQTAVVSQAESTITSTPPLFSPSVTPVELVAQVNGESISLEEYRAELARFRAASGTSLATYGEEVVLEDLIDQVLLAQAAVEAGFVVDEAMLQTHIQGLDVSEQTLQEWMTIHGYTEESFRRAMKRSIAAAWMRDQIIADVPDTAEQVHARQILLYNSDEADSVFAQLETGTDFGTLAAKYEPLTLGDLGWFPRSYLTVAEIDDVVFALDPGEYTPIIETSLGYHIVQVIERDPQHPLSLDALQVMQVRAVRQWLDAHRSQSEVVILLP